MYIWYIRSNYVVVLAVHSTVPLITPTTEAERQLLLIVISTTATTVTLLIVGAVIAAITVCTKLCLCRKHPAEQGQYDAHAYEKELQLVLNISYCRNVVRIIQFNANYSYMFTTVYFFKLSVSGSKQQKQF